MMSSAESRVNVRPMTFVDMKDIFFIDQAIRVSGVSKTYSGYTTQQMFNMDETDPSKRSDILEIAKLTDLGLVAECEGKVCGFALGRLTHLAERNIDEGEIAIIGIHPNHQRQGIAVKLVESIHDLLRSRGADRIRIGLDPADAQMQGFFEKIGYDSQHLVYYHTSL
jgi:ribosomal protein S18 acetylase RimI-like enzyme